MGGLADNHDQPQGDKQYSMSKAESEWYSDMMAENGGDPNDCQCWACQVLQTGKHDLARTAVYVPGGPNGLPFARVTIEVVTPPKDSTEPTEQAVMKELSDRVTEAITQAASTLIRDQCAMLTSAHIEKLVEAEGHDAVAAAFAGMAQGEPRALEQMLVKHWPDEFERFDFGKGGGDASTD